MKKAVFIIAICVLLSACASNSVSVKTEPDVVLATPVMVEPPYSITSDIFDILQRPLSFTLSSQCKTISRLNWEYHMTGIGWWDIYLMTGRKLGNGIYERKIENKSNCQLIELHSTRTPYDNAVLTVEMVFVSTDKSVLEKLQADFISVAVQFTGKQGEGRNNEERTWNAGWITYTSYPIQHHESGKWVYLISSFDSAHSPY